MSSPIFRSRHRRPEPGKAPPGLSIDAHRPAIGPDEQGGAGGEQQQCHAGSVPGGRGRARERRPTPEELARVLSHLSPQMQDVVSFAVASAMRRGEICRIRWDDLEADRRLVLIRDRKHPKRTQGNHKLVPLVDRTGIDAWAIAQRQPKGDERIFPLSTEYVSDTFAAACKAAGVVDLHFHDLRHEATSRLFEAGMSIEQVAVITGHEDWRNLKKYTNLKPESLHGKRPDTPQRL